MQQLTKATMGLLQTSHQLVSFSYSSLKNRLEEVPWHNIEMSPQGSLLINFVSDLDEEIVGIMIKSAYDTKLGVTSAFIFHRSCSDQDALKIRKIKEMFEKILRDEVLQKDFFLFCTFSEEKEKYLRILEKTECKNNHCLRYCMNKS